MGVGRKGERMEGEEKGEAGRIGGGRKNRGRQEG